MITVLYFHQTAAKGLQGSLVAWDRELKVGGVCEASRSVALTSPRQEGPVNSVIMFAFVHQESEHPNTTFAIAKCLKQALLSGSATAF